MYSLNTFTTNQGHSPFLYNSDTSKLLCLCLIDFSGWLSCWFRCSPSKHFHVDWKLPRSADGSLFLHPSPPFLPCYQHLYWWRILIFTHAPLSAGTVVFLTAASKLWLRCTPFMFTAKNGTFHNISIIAPHVWIMPTVFLATNIHYLWRMGGWNGCKFDK